jgi:calcium-dependent protein kinase
MDLQQSNRLNYTEFLRATIDRNLVLNKENLRKAFDMFDEDGNGFVTREEVRDWLNDGLMVEDQVLAELMKQMDNDGDGMIDFRDFEELVESAGREK